MSINKFVMPINNIDKLIYQQYQIKLTSRELNVNTISIKKKKNIYFYQVQPSIITKGVKLRVTPQNFTIQY